MAGHEIDLESLYNNIQTKSDLAAFVSALHDDLVANEDAWENATLDRFLEAMSAWIEVMDQVYKNNNQAIPHTPQWKTFADILLAARVYE